MKIPHEAEPEKVRLDKWLWAARFFKTRALATKAIQQGKVLYEGRKPTPSREVKIGAQITLPQGHSQITVIVRIINTKRQGASIAQTTYQETPESIAQRDLEKQKKEDLKWMRLSAPKPPKKPEKNARRNIRKLRRQD